jgi:hypothetical protein
MTHGTEHRQIEVDGCRVPAAEGRAGKPKLVCSTSQAYFYGKETRHSSLLDEGGRSMD